MYHSLHHVDVGRIIDQNNMRSLGFVLEHDRKRAKEDKFVIDISDSDMASSCFPAKIEHDRVGRSIVRYLVVYILGYGPLLLVAGYSFLVGW